MRERVVLIVSDLFTTGQLQDFLFQSQIITVHSWGRDITHTNYVTLAASVVVIEQFGFVQFLVWLQYTLLLQEFLVIGIVGLLYQKDAAGYGCLLYTSPSPRD